MELEVIAINLADIEVLNQSVADRVEYCTDLEVGGLTPTYKQMLEVIAASKLPVNIMVRPTNRDFYYTEEEFQQMLEDVKFLASTNVNGIVIGIINPDGTINLSRMKQVMDLANGKHVTFHRAFEKLNDPIEGLYQLKELGVDRVLTSGNGDIMTSIDLLKTLKETKEVKILGGSGINLFNVDQISDVVDEIHVGTAVRKNLSWQEPILVEEIAKFKEILANK